ncbi:hypothetical protein J7E83_15905 [Arthrobacter sp. ISL-48]|uniref:hypothetical protein n=1 Tax=Arthrobacter sp. ISL-48 TaxID=2819110 RepID=UPI001BE6A496|nr:hypothetical protein [Arthrobacter sp. ISL-48]MBT2533578.1 hypothetical protein [Arthrobacter sp. ISL-48]
MRKVGYSWTCSPPNVDRDGGVYQQLNTPIPEGAAFVPEPVLISLVLAENQDDYMSLGMLSYLIQRAGPVPPVTGHHHVLPYLANLLGEGLVTIGDVDGEQFLPWNCAVTEALSRVRKQWPDGEASDYKTLRDIGWLTNTPRGNGVAVGAVKP